MAAAEPSAKAVRDDLEDIGSAVVNAKSRIRRRGAEAQRNLFVLFGNQHDGTTERRHDDAKGSTTFSVLASGLRNCVSQRGGALVCCDPPQPKRAVIRSEPGA